MSLDDASILIVKIGTQLLLPLGLSIGVLTVGILLSFGRRPPISRLLLCMGGSLLWLSSIPPVADWAIGTLESRFPPRAMADTPSADVAILLGGGIDAPSPPRLDAEFNDGGDRVIHAARLFRAGKVSRILVTGGNLSWSTKGVPEAEHMRNYLLELGIPADAVVTAGQSRNTIENAREILALYDRAPWLSALLVTSAAHMPRAMQIFQRAGLTVIASSTDVRGVAPAMWTPLDLLPDVQALALTSQATKEWVGLIALRFGLQR